MPRKRALEDHVLDVVAQQPVVDVPGNGVLVDGEASQGSLHSVKRKKKRVRAVSKQRILPVSSRVMKLTNLS